MPLASGALTGKYSATARPAGWRRYTGYFHGKNLAALARLVELLREIGARHDRSPGQVALRWLIQQEGVLPIPRRQEREPGHAERRSAHLHFG
jgi:aryl-alcohol dehydrogenase-like predicted oxidoreductase